jgi:hypothetical protein
MGNIIDVITAGVATQPVLKSNGETEHQTVVHNSLQVAYTSNTYNGGPILNTYMGGDAPKVGAGVRVYGAMGSMLLRVGTEVEAIYDTGNDRITMGAQVGFAIPIPGPGFNSLMPVGLLFKGGTQDVTDPLTSWTASVNLVTSLSVLANFL